MVGRDHCNLNCEDGNGDEGISLPDQQHDSSDGKCNEKLKNLSLRSKIETKDEVRRVLIYATLSCDNESRKVAFRYLDWNFTVAKLREDLCEHTLQCFPLSQSQDLFQLTLTWADTDGNTFTLNDDQLPLRKLCEWKNFDESPQKSPTENGTFVSNQEKVDGAGDDKVLEVQFSCFRESCPSPSLVEKILSIAVGKRPLDFFRDYQTFIRSDPTFEGQRTSLNSFAAKEGGFSGVDILSETSFSQSFIDGDQVDVSSGLASDPEKCIYSTEVNDFLRVSVSGFTRFAHSDPSVGPERFYYLEAALYYGVESVTSATSDDDQQMTSLSPAPSVSFLSTTADSVSSPSSLPPPPQITSLGRERWSLSHILRSAIWDSSNSSRQSMPPVDKCEFEFPVSISQLPKHTKLCMTYNFVPKIQKTSLSPNRFYFRLIDTSTSAESSGGVPGSSAAGASGGMTGGSPNNMYSKNTSFRSDAIVDSYVIIPLFNSEGHLNTSLGNLVFWRMPTSESNTNVLHSPIGTVYRPFCQSNQQYCQQHAGFIVKKLVLEHQQGNMPIIYRSDNPSCSRRETQQNMNLETPSTPRNTRFLSISFSRYSTESELIDVNNPSKFAQTLSEMDWADKSSNDDLQSALDELTSSNSIQNNLPLHLCLHCLTYKCVNRSIRDLAVRGLQNVSRGRIRPLLPALIQGLKFEDRIDSPLARFLLSQAVSVDDVRLGYEMCWSLLVESENPHYQGLFLVLLETLLRNCVPKVAYFFLKALMCDREMSNWARSVQTAYKHYSPEAAHYSFMRNLSLFEGVPVPFESMHSCFYLLSDFEVNRANNLFKVPLCNLFKPAQRLEGIRKSGCKIMNSKKLPLWITLKKKKTKNKISSEIHRAQTFSSPSINKRHFATQDTENKSATLEIPNNNESSRSTMTSTNSNFLGLGFRNGVNLGSRSTLSSSKNSLTDVEAEDYPDIKTSKTSLESESGVFDREDPKPLNIGSCENISGIYKSRSLRLPKRTSNSYNCDEGPSSPQSRTSSNMRKTDSAASEVGSDKMAQKLTNFHNQTLETSMFAKVLNHFTDATHTASLYDIRWASLKTQKAEIARVRAGTQGPEMVAVESFDLANLLLDSSTDQWQDDTDAADVSNADDDDDSEYKLSQLEKTVMLEPVGFIEDSFAIAGSKNMNTRSTTVSRHRTFSLNYNSDEADSSSFNLNCKSSKKRCYNRRSNRPSVELKSYRRKNEAEDEMHRVCEMIYKSGDDLRQDMLIMRAFDLMLDIWRKSPRTNKIVIKTYGCIATSDDTGAIEVVQDAITLCRTQKIFNTRLNRNRMTWDKDSLKKWLQENNRDEDWPKVEEKFFWSALGSCVATFILGIGDRHSDNMMIQRDGTFLHIDFGHMLGNFKKFKMIARETTPFFFTPDIVEVIGGFDSANYLKFKAYFVTAYMAIREHASLFISMFQLMLGAGMPELRFPEHVNFLTEKTFMLQLTPHMNSYDVTNATSDSSTTWHDSPSQATSFSSVSSAKVNEETKMIHSKIMDVVNAAASNQRQILNQKIHQLK